MRRVGVVSVVILFVSRFIIHILMEYYVTDLNDIYEHS